MTKRKIEEYVIGSTSISFIVLAVLAIIAGTVGWIMNIVKLLGMNFDSGFTAELIIRGIGVIMPLVGAVAGWF